MTAAATSDARKRLAERLDASTPDPDCTGCTDCYPPPVTVTDEMVEQAIEAFWKPVAGTDHHARMRAALSAALDNGAAS